MPQANTDDFEPISGAAVQDDFQPIPGARLQRPSLTEKAKRVGTAILEGEHATESPETTIFGAAMRPIKETGKGLLGLAKEIAYVATPPSLRPKEQPTEGLVESAGNLASVLPVAFPALLPIMMGGSAAGEIVHRVTGSPKAAGAVELASNFLTPSGIEKVAAKLSKSYAAKVAARLANEKTAIEELAKLRDAEKAAKYTEQRARAGVRAATLGEKSAEDYLALAEGQLASKTGERIATEAAESAITARGETAIEKAQAEAGKFATSRGITPKISTLGFGEAFKGPDYAPKGEFGGYYRESKATAYAKSAEEYDKAFQAAEGKVADAGLFSGELQAELDKAGVAAEIVPTRAEQFARRVTETFDPVSEADNAYRQVKDMLTREQFEYIAKGTGSTPGTGGVPAIPTDAARVIVAALQKGAGKSSFLPEMSKAMDSALAGGKLPVLTQIPARDALILRQRINGAIRAAESAGKRDVAYQLRTYRGAIERTLPKDVLPLIQKADQNYVSKYIKYFGPEAELTKIFENKNPAKVFRALVPKDDPAMVQQVTQALSPEARQGLKGAFYDALYQSGQSREGVNWAKVISEYDSYSTPVKEALLGSSKPAWDTLMGNLHNFNREKQQLVSKAESILKEELQRNKVAQTILKNEEAAAGKTERAARTSLGKATQARTKAELGFDKAKQDLELRRAATQEFLDALKAAAEPNLTHFQGQRRVVARVLAVKDFAEFLMGVGGYRILVWGLADLVTAKALDPRFIAKIQARGDQAMTILNGAMSGAPGSSNRLRNASALFTLLDHMDAQDETRRAQSKD